METLELNVGLGFWFGHNESQSVLVLVTCFANLEGMVVKMIPKRWLMRNSWVVVWECVFLYSCECQVQLPGVEIQQVKQARL